MEYNQCIIILSKLETLLAIRTNKNDYTQTFNTREVSFDGLLRDPFRKQTIASCSSNIFSNIRARAFLMVFPLLA